MRIYNILYFILVCFVLTHATSSHNGKCYTVRKFVLLRASLIYGVVISLGNGLLSAPIHYLSKCQLSIRWAIKDKLHQNLNHNTLLYFRKNSLENFICKMEVIFFRWQRVCLENVLSHVGYFKLITFRHNGRNGV